MNDIALIPFNWARFDKKGRLVDENDRPASDPKVPAGTTDLVVVSHGWKNSEKDATELYTRLFTNFANVTKDDPSYAQRKLAIIGVLWPAKQFDLAMTNVGASGTTAGGTLSAGSSASAEDSEKAMQEAIDRAAKFFDEPDEVEQLAKLRALIPALENNEKKAKEDFVGALRRMLDPDGQAAAMKSDDDGSRKFFGGNAEHIFDQAKRPAPASTQDPTEPVKKNPNAPVGSGSGQEAGFFGDLVSGAANGVANLLNLTTYFKMKIRAGTVGSKGVAPLIDRLAAQVERIHLVGHSFGGRLVAAAAADSTTPKLHSLSLLQAAFSHNGFSSTHDGFFRTVVENKRVKGPVLITHTKNDRAVGLAYPAASRISRDRALGFGDADDEFGGIGSNGAQQMNPGEIFADTNRLVEVKGAYGFQAGKLHNLESSEYIVDPGDPKRDAHGFVFVPQVAWAISRAVVSP